jgi:hypothetical protein
MRSLDWTGRTKPDAFSRVVRDHKIDHAREQRDVHGFRLALSVVGHHDSADRDLL